MTGPIATSFGPPAPLATGWLRGAQALAGFNSAMGVARIGGGDCDRRYVHSIDTMLVRWFP